MTSLPPFGQTFLLFFFLIFFLFKVKQYTKSNVTKVKTKTKNAKVYPEQENMQDDTNTTFQYEHFQSLKQGKKKKANKKKVRQEKNTKLFYPKSSYRKVHCC